MYSTLRTSLPLLTFLAILLVAVPLVGAPSSLKVTLPAGETEISVGGVDLVVTASDPVVLYVVVDQGQVYGTVEPPHGSTADPYVTIVVRGQGGAPDETIFAGKVTGVTPFDSLKPHETGHVDL